VVFRILRALLCVVIILAGTAALVQSSGDTDRVEDLVTSAANAEGRGDFEAANAFAEEALALAKPWAEPDHPKRERFGLLSYRQAGYLLALGRNNDAEAAARDAMQALAATQGATPTTGIVVGRLAETLRRQGQFARAAEYFTVFDKLTVGNDADPSVQWGARNAALNAAWLGAYDDATRRLSRLAEIAVPEIEYQITMDRLDVALMADRRVQAGQILAGIDAEPGIAAAFPAYLAFYRAKYLRLTYEYTRAEKVLDTLIARAERGTLVIPEGLKTGVYNLSGITKLGRGLSDDARERFLRALSNLQAGGIFEGMETANVLTGLAAASMRSGDIEGAVGRLNDAIDAATKALGEDNILVSPIRSELASALIAQGQIDPAQVVLDRIDAAMAETDMSIPRFRRIAAQAKVTRARLLMEQGNDARALAFVTTLIADVETWDGSQSWLLPTPLTWASELHEKAGNYAMALAAAQRAIDIRQGYDAVGPSKLIASYYRKARALMGLDNLTEARAVADQAVTLLERYATLMLDSRNAVDLDAEIRAWRAMLELALELSFDPDRAPSALFLRSMQLAHATASEASMINISRAMARRDDPRGTILAQREVLFAEIRQLQSRAVVAPALAVDGAVDLDAGKLLVDRLKQLDDLNEQIEARFPSAGLLSDIGFVSLDKVQAQLAPDEALIAMLSTEAATFSIIIRPNGARVVRRQVGRATLRAAVERVRAGLDLDGDIFDGDQLNLNPNDLFNIYQVVFGGFSDELQGVGHVIFVPAGPLQSLPPHVLLTRKIERLDISDLANAPWFVRDAAISILPSVRAFLLGRQAPQTRRGDRHLGIGDPVLSGEDGAGVRGLVAASGAGKNGLANPQMIARLLPRLPETAVEANEVAALLAVDRSTVLLGENATEARLKSMNLRDFDTLHFATHGLLASETGYFASGLFDPALVLTPPQSASPFDDGLLSAPEIALLDIRARLVILSACNTASPSGSANADGFSGLTKSFFSAGAETILVSHWVVGSGAAKSLIVDLSGRLKDRNSRAVSEALQDAMLAMMVQAPSTGIPLPSHPAVWGPFVAVGATN